jgi:phage repressor protein C with HTH and peptisase S24 domain
MPGSVIPINAPLHGLRAGVYVLVEAVLPQRPARNIGVLLIDSATDRAYFRLRPHFHDIADPEDVEVLAEIEEYIRACTAQMGGEAFLRSLEDAVSSAIRVTDRQDIRVDSFTTALDRLYSEHVETVEVKPFRTHLPLYSFKAAAGSLGEEMLSQVEDWVPAPEGMRLTEDLFVGHVVGRSMEPRIPDGSLNLFRLHPQGSRQGKILLVERFGALDETARYTVKRYTSKKVATGDDQWEHEQIRLEPLNPEFEAWDAEPEGFAVVAEWLRVIE